MNNKPNTIPWEIGDIVIHDDDEKSAEMVMRVVETGCEFGMVRTEYVNEGSPLYLNDIKYLHDPLIFGIDVFDRSAPDIYKRAISRWGVDAQRSIFVEEAAEAITALSHFKRGKCGIYDVIGEFADLQIMLNQMKVIYGEEQFDRIFVQKLTALKAKLDQGNGL